MTSKTEELLKRLRSITRRYDSEYEERQKESLRKYWELEERRQKIVEARREARKDASPLAQKQGDVVDDCFHIFKLKYAQEWADKFAPIVATWTEEQCDEWNRQGTNENTGYYIQRLIAEAHVAEREEIHDIFGYDE